MIFSTLLLSHKTRMFMFSKAFLFSSISSTQAINSLLVELELHSEEENFLEVTADEVQGPEWGIWLALELQRTLAAA